MNQDLDQVAAPSGPRVIPVLDLRGGVAVHARGGRRDLYEPVRGLHGRGEEPVALARSIRDDLGLDTFYIADLDALTHGRPQLALLERLAADGIMTWVDAGIKSPDEATALLDAGASRIIAATETLPGPTALAEVADRVSPSRLIFGLDLNDGRPRLAPESEWPGAVALDLVGTAVGLGVRHVLLLDMARVGTGRGTGTLCLISELARLHPSCHLTGGGGVSGPDDLGPLFAGGVSSVLVGSAIHNGRIGSREATRWIGGSRLWIA